MARVHVGIMGRVHVERYREDRNCKTLNGRPSEEGLDSMGLGLAVGRDWWN